MSRTVENSAAFVVPHLQPHFHILDIGCGPGTITRGFCPLVPQGHVTGVDVSEEVIQRAREDASRLSPAPPANISWLVADVLSDDGIPFPAGSFDVVYTHQTFIHLPNPRKALREIYRLLKPGGQSFVAMREADAFHWWPDPTGGLDLWVKGMSKMMEAQGAHAIPSGRYLHVWAAEAGFPREKMRVGAGATCHANEEERRWWAGLQIERLQSSAVGEKMRQGGMTDEEMAKVIEALRQWQEDERGWYALLQAEVICWK